MSVKTPRARTGHASTRRNKPLGLGRLNRQNRLNRPNRNITTDIDIDKLLNKVNPLKADLTGRVIIDYNDPVQKKTAERWLRD